MQGICGKKIACPHYPTETRSHSVATIVVHKVVPEKTLAQPKYQWRQKVSVWDNGDTL